MYGKLYAATRSDTIDVVKSAYWRVCNADTPNEEILPAYYLHRVAYVDEPFTLNQEAEFLFHHPSVWSAIYRRDFLQGLNIRMKEVPGAGWVDNPFLIETLAQARSIVYIDEPLYYYRELNAGSSSIVKDPSVLYERWFDMDSLIVNLGATSPRILEGHYCRGCAHIDMLNQDFDTSSPAIKNAIQDMIEHMDCRVISASPNIIRRYKDAYRSHLPLGKQLAFETYRLLNGCLRRIRPEKRGRNDTSLSNTPPPYRLRNLATWGVVNKKQVRAACL